MFSRRAAFSFSLVTLALLAMLLRAFLLGPPDGSQQLLAKATSLLVLAGLVGAICVAVSNKLRGKGELIAFGASLLVTTITFAYSALMIYVFDAAAHS